VIEESPRFGSEEDKEAGVQNGLWKMCGKSGNSGKEEVADKISVL